MELLSNSYVITGIVMVIVFTLYMAVDAMFGRKEEISQLETRTGIKTPASGPALSEGAQEDDLITTEQEKSGLGQTTESLLEAVGIDVDTQVKEAQLELQRAGFSSPDAPYFILFMRFFGRWIFVLIGALFLFDGTTSSFLIGFLFIIAGFMGTDLYIKNRTAKRGKTLTRSFPDMLDLMVVCVESGLALDAAFNRVCKELGRAHPAITTELNRTRMELALLNDRSKALQNMADRTNLVPFRSLVAALIQTEKFGTSLADTLRVLSDDIRQKRLSLAEEKAGKLPAMMTIPLVLLLLPSLVLILLGPVFIRVAEQGGIFPD